MRGPSISLLANGRLLLSRNAVIAKRLYFSASLRALKTPNDGLSICGNRFQSSVSAKSDQVTLEALSQSSTIFPVVEKAPIASQIPSQNPDDYPADSEARAFEDGENGEELGQEETPVEKVYELRKAYIAIGSNMGDRIHWLEKALKAMPQRGIKVLRTSSLWETEPMYVTDQGKFLNGVVEVQTSLGPYKLLTALQAIEIELGRRKLVDKGPRNIDLDILHYEDEKVSVDHLIIPHLLMFEREFVLRPLAELIPDAKLNSNQPERSVEQFLHALPPSNPPMYSVSCLSSKGRLDAIKPQNPKQRTHIMGILNVTPDSFSDGGKYGTISPIEERPDSARTKDQAGRDKKNLTETLGLKRLAKFTRDFEAKNMATPIIDIGGLSTRPGALEITAEEEIARVVPMIKYLRHRTSLRYTISIDTYRASVAEAAIKAGADIVNDISAGQLDPEMLSTVARSGKTIVLMHMRGNPRTMQNLTDYSEHGLIPTIAKELSERVKEAEKAGIHKWRIILDPGIGFAKTEEQNLEILRDLRRLTGSEFGLGGYPWLVGASRKGFIGRITGVEVPERRVIGSVVAVAAAVEGGADIVRVHDVAQSVEAVKMLDAIWRSGTAKNGV